MIPLTTLIIAALSPISVKDEIASYRAALIETPQSSELHYKLALAHLKDQEVDRAFLSFLEALKWVPCKEPLSLDECGEALDLYLSSRGGDPSQSSKDLIHRYAQESERSLPLKLLVALAHANLGEYQSFIEKFYAVYPYFSESFLADKTKGILYLHLLQHVAEPKARQFYEREAKKALSRALDRYPQDAGLYKILFFLAKEEGNTDRMRELLLKMSRERVLVARSDLPVYVHEATLLDEYEVAKQMVARAKESYEYSRAILAAEAYLKEEQNHGR